MEKPLKHQRRLVLVDYEFILIRRLVFIFLITFMFIRNKVYGNYELILIRRLVFIFLITFMFIRNKVYGNAFISYESLIIELWAIITGVYMPGFIIVCVFV